MTSIILIWNINYNMALIWDVFQEFEAPGYCQEGIQEFKSYIELDKMADRLHQKEMLLLGYFVECFHISLFC